MKSGDFYCKCLTCGKDIFVKENSRVGELDIEHIKSLKGKPVFCNTKCYERSA